MPRKSSSRKLSRLAEELRTAAKTSLDNPGALTPQAVPLLHSLPAVQERALETGDPVRAIRRWLVEDLLREFEVDPLPLFPGNRQEALRRRLIVTYLFQLDPVLAGHRITKRRALLAGRLWGRQSSDDYDRAIDPETDEEDPRRVDSMRQTEEPPVLERLAHLVGRQIPLVDPRPPERRDAQRLLKDLSRMCLTLLADLWSWLDTVDTGDTSGRASASLRDELPEHARGRYGHLAPEVSGTDYLLRVLWTYMEIDAWWRLHGLECLRLMYRFRHEIRGPLFGVLTELESWHGDRDSHSPWPPRQKSVLRAAHAGADGEYGAFLSWLDTHPSGRLIRAVWIRWVMRSNRTPRAPYEISYGFVVYVRDVSRIEEALGQDLAGLGPAINELLEDPTESSEVWARLVEARAKHDAYVASLWKEVANESKL